MKNGQEGIGKRHSHDREMWERIDKLVTDYKISTEDLLSNFPVYCRRIHLTRFLAHYEIFKLVMDLPGAIVELGVFRGASLLTFAKLMEIFCPGDRSRKVIGFDWFSGLEGFSQRDGPMNASMSKEGGGWGAEAFKSELLEHIDIFHTDSFIPRAKRVEVVVGDILETVPRYVTDNPGLRISLLHFDCDLYEPTCVGLSELYPLVVTGGVVLFDEYGLREWAGESAAVDEFFAGKGVIVKKLPWTSTPGGYVVKP